jgi:hypothetical protein
MKDEGLSTPPGSTRVVVTLSFISHLLSLIPSACPRGAARSARLPVTQDDHEDVVPGVQIPSRAPSTNTARYANRQSGQAQTLVICGFESRLRHS